MKTKQNHIKEVVKSVVATMMKVDEREWPPSCSFLIYQPVRPQVRNNNKDTSASK